MYQVNVEAEVCKSETVADVDIKMMHADPISRQKFIRKCHPDRLSVVGMVDAVDPTDVVKIERTALKTYFCWTSS